MDVDVTFIPAEHAQLDVRGRIVVAIDVVRAATTIAVGLANGCRGFLPVPSLAAARRLSRAQAVGEALLGGEGELFKGVLERIAALQPAPG